MPYERIIIKRILHQTLEDIEKFNSGSSKSTVTAQVWM